MPIFMFFFLVAILEDVFDNRSQLASQQSTELTPPLLKWTRPFRRKKKSGFCACAIKFQTQFYESHATRSAQPIVKRHLVT